MSFKLPILSSLKILFAVTAGISIWYYYISMSDIRRLTEQKFIERAGLVSTYISMMQQKVDGMARTIGTNYGKQERHETGYARYYREYGVWGLSGYADDGGGESLAGTCTGTGKFPLTAAEKKELSAVLSIDPQVGSILEFNKNVTWIYYTSAKQFLYLCPKLKIKEYQFSLSEYKRPFWYQAAPENNPKENQIISDLYEDSVGKGLMITISSPVKAEGEFIGVMSLDLGTELLKQLALMGEILGESILVDENGKIVVRMGDFSINEKYEPGITYGEWHHADDGFIWMSRSIAGGELNMLHRLKKTGYYIAAARRSLVVWILASFMFILFFLVSRDITIRRQEAAALKNSEEKFRSLVENLNDIVRLINPSGRVVYISSGIRNLLGYDVSEFEGGNFNSIIHPDDLTSVYETITRMYKERKKAEGLKIRVLHKNGTWLWFLGNWYPLKNEKGRITACIGVARDITEQKLMEDALLESETRLKAFMENVPSLIVIKDHELRPIFCNNAFMTYFPFNDWSGRKPDEIFPEDVAKVMIEKDTEALTAGNVSYEETWTDKNGTIHHFLTQKFRIDRPDKEPMLGAIITDITDRKSAEAEREKLREQLSQAQKMESVGRLAGGVAHDFNNMLGVIIGQAELALMKSEPSSPVYQRLIEIEKAAKRSADLTGRLLAFARKQTVIPKVLDLNETIAGMISMLRRLIGEDIELVWTPGVDIWPVRIDPSQIDQILANLCVNAKDAISGTGTIRIETSNASSSEIKGTSYSDVIPGDYAMFAVSDTGSGISKDIFEHLFEPFFTTKELGKGTGLGLAMIYGIVRQNNGFITVDSKPGEGTVFRIYFPRYRGAADRDEITASSCFPLTGNDTILLVEDEPMLLEMSRTMLEELGYSVIAVATPDDALRIAGEHSGEIKLLITDVIMPGMNGRDLAGKIIARFPEMKSLYMSGYTADVISPHGVLESNVNFIQKPFNINDLAVKISEILCGDVNTKG